MELSLGYSPCPNDCFIFYALAHNKVVPEINWQIVLDDVEALNQLAKQKELDISKVSYHAYAYLLEDYVMLHSGGALGKGVGPLIVSKDKLHSLSGKKVAIPGGLTTANLLLKLSQPDDIITVNYRYDEIMPAVARAEVDAGLIIHESRFTYSKYGLKKYLDLGEWWEEKTGLLLPLGGIVAKRKLPDELLYKLEEALRESLQYSYEHSKEVEPYIAKHAQEMSAEVRQKHIDLYVNNYSFDVGDIGERSVIELFERARAQNLLPKSDKEVFLSRR